MEERDRINVRTSDQIDTFLYSLEKSANRAGLKFRGRKLSKEPLVNAIIANLIDQNQEAIIESIKTGIERYERQLESVN